ncbi:MULTISPECIES: TIGR02117 family protein [Sphingomonas]|jgi:uncharacterized protein (TIGR02117 family)|uniref:TIGR02117 family protein n=1 Tax=Sphingomonas TaxID=13687 RepID=UPI001AEDE741|nr:MULTISPECIES: TIGR02117 family protein [Sphingomonas]
MKLYARWLFRSFAGAGALVVSVLLAYGAAGLVGGALPAHAAWRPPAQGIPIWVESNGIHVSLVLPKVAAGIDLRPLAPAGDIADPRYARYDHLAIGWGDEAFFLGTPTWADVRPGTILAAAAGSDRTLLHVEHVPGPVEMSRRIVLRPTEYRRLIAFVQATLKPGGRILQSYDRNDAFYPARGHYSAIRTCNAWVGDALRHAGVRVGRWTPFPVTILGWFPPRAAAER